jgi:ATP-dependent Lhr-like helicase
MDNGRWSGLSALYVCPLKALLNNLLPRLEQYTGWLAPRSGTATSPPLRGRRSCATRQTCC